MIQSLRLGTGCSAAALRWVARTGLMILVPPIILLALIPTIGTITGWFIERPPLPGFGILYQAAMESPRTIFHVISALYLQLAMMIALVVVPYTIGRASFWKPFNRWVDHKVHVGLGRLPLTVRKPLMAIVGATVLCLLVWLVATAPM